MKILMMILLVVIFSAVIGLIWAKIRGKSIPTLVIIMLGFMGVCFAGIISFVNQGENYQTYQKLRWQPLQPEKIAAYVEQGKIVFVDITADWCVPCQTNKANVLYREQVVERLNDPQIILMQGNWTQADEVIERYMGQQAAAGTPFNKVYGSSYPEGIELPKALVIDDLYQALSLANHKSVNILR
ncbi:thioredoxin family protein [Shewanella polaris]|uniref:Thiol:disulfide interchange protein n=1 Tax=Shewanella polaris TaxID=2588449 RepID=A0A4Y5YCE1_9GAMM|nr:thioredoxin family protein [Shewanella polaris]QDE30223.1 thiol:disulfide interchange protein [Shewanella polaris]